MAYVAGVKHGRPGDVCVTAHPHLLSPPGTQHDAPRNPQSESWIRPAMNPPALRIGIIGCDSSHATEFTAILNDETAANHVPGARVVAACKAFSEDFEMSRSRVDGFIAELCGRWGVQLTGSIGELCDVVDAVIIGSVDGRPHLEQAREVIAAGKPVFVDKPLAATLRDAIEIVRLAEQAKVPLWTGSAYRWYASMVEVRDAAVGEVRGAVSFGPAHLGEHHPDFCWYGIHATEALYSVLGPGCESVTRTKSPYADVVVGRWSGERTGTLIGLRTKVHPHQVTVFGSEGFAQQKAGDDGYAPLVAQIVRFLRSGIPPVSHAETIEMFAFMEAADESARRGGVPVRLGELPSLVRSR